MVNRNSPKVTQEFVNRKLGILCDSCGGSVWETTHTRTEIHRIVRYRRCRTCGNRVRTEEFAKISVKK